MPNSVKGEIGEQAPHADRGRGARNSANADKTAEMKAKRPASSPLPQEMKRQKTVLTTLRDPALILDNMLKIVKESYTEKYGALMAAGTEIVKSKIMRESVARDYHQLVRTEQIPEC
jgi:hypothetical protein